MCSVSGVVSTVNVQQSASKPAVRTVHSRPQSRQNTSADVTGVPNDDSDNWDSSDNGFGHDQLDISELMN